MVQLHVLNCLIRKASKLELKKETQDAVSRLAALSVSVAVAQQNSV
jgi:hypothetical protein